MITKFRAWFITNKVMIPPMTLTQAIHQKENQFPLARLEDEFIFMMSTNLFDKDGREIFEGDILFNEHDEEYAEVVFKDGCFFIEATYWTAELYECCELWLIVGDIYQNKELLEVE